MRQPTHTADRRDVHVSVDGPMVVAVDGEPIDLAWGKGRELIAYVACYGPVHVEGTAEALWPNLPPGHGRQRLRNLFLRAKVVIVRDGPLFRLPKGATVDYGDDPGAILPEYPFEEWAERVRRRGA